MIEEMCIVLKKVDIYPFAASRIACPAASRFASLISEYLRDRITPFEPALKAARVAA